MAVAAAMVVVVVVVVVIMCKVMNEKIYCCS